MRPLTSCPISCSILKLYNYILALSLNGPVRLLLYIYAYISSTNEKVEMNVMPLYSSNTCTVKVGHVAYHVFKASLGNRVRTCLKKIKD